MNHKFSVKFNFVYELAPARKENKHDSVAVGTLIGGSNVLYFVANQHVKREVKEDRYKLKVNDTSQIPP